MQKSSSKTVKNTRLLYSAICVSIIALGVIVYFASAGTSDSVNKSTTITETTIEAAQEAQHAVTVKETTTAKQTTTAAPSTTKKESASMAQGDTNTPYKSFYKYPVGEEVQRAFSTELAYDETMEDYRSHAAVDFACTMGASVESINDGIVLSVQKDGMWGNVVEIDHGGKLVAVYKGLDNVSVAKGDSVAIGQAIGTVGTIPCESAQESHLHLETKLDGEFVDPLKVMGKTEETTSAAS